MVWYTWIIIPQHTEKLLHCCNNAPKCHLHVTSNHSCNHSYFNLETDKSEFNLWSCTELCMYPSLSCNKGGFPSRFFSVINSDSQTIRLKLEWIMFAHFALQHFYTSTSWKWEVCQSYFSSAAALWQSPTDGDNLITTDHYVWWETESAQFNSSGVKIMT